MRIKKYYAPNPNDAFRQIRAELGVEAIILNTQKVRQGGWLGFLRGPIYEISVAIDVPREDTQKSPSNGEASARQAPQVMRQEPQALSQEPQVVRQEDQGVRQEGQAMRQDSQALRQEDNPAVRQEPQPLWQEGQSVRQEGQTVWQEPQVARQAPQPTWQEPQPIWQAPQAMRAYPAPVPVPIVSELEEIRTSLKQLQETMGQFSENHNNNKNVGKRSPQLAKLRDLLCLQGLDEQITQDIMKHIDFELSRQAMQEWMIVRTAAARHLEQVFNTVDLIDTGDGGPTVLFVVGPTGVGKTTTVAKLAAMFAADKSRNVSLVTMDTVRIGAIPQLQAYADILGVPLEVVYSPTELSRHLDTHSTEDIVLVDTPGWSPKAANRAKLPEFVNAVENCMVLLAASATTKDSDAMRSVEELNGIPVHGLIITKIDETKDYGSTFNLVHSSSLPVAFVTTGQNVPEDIEVADPRRMAMRLLGVER